jgi:glycosyltransferase involved in cell wall biosynthesis
MTGTPDLSFVCPVYNKKTYLRAFVDSLLAQDNWQRCELIAVENGSTDGSWEELQAIVADMSEDDSQHVLLLRLPSPNACIARNEGMRASRGRYVSFLPADAVLYPGVASNWVRTLDEHPEYGFVYSGYHFGPPRSGELVSREFSVEALRERNYIDGSFPIRRELFPYWNHGGYDPAVRSLQDWDFWLAVVLGPKRTGSGVRGLFQPGFAFEAAPPQPGGLTEDAMNNAEARLAYVRNKWAAPQRKAGLRAFARRLLGRAR